MTCCLKCGGDFRSEDPVRIRICNPCKGGSDWKGSSPSDARYPSNHGSPKIADSGRGKQPPKATVLRGTAGRFGDKPRSKKRVRV
jgi:hypothetical protein